MGGRLFDEVEKIKKEEISKVLERVSYITSLPLDYLELRILGSGAKNKKGEFGKKSALGDLDIGIDNYTLDEFFDSKLLSKKSPSDICILKGFGIISTKVDLRNKFVQVDFIFGKLDLLKFMYHYSEKSNFPSSYRNILMRELVSAKRREVYEDGKLVALVGPTLIYNKGIVNQWRHFPLSKNGKERLKRIVNISLEEFNKLYPKHRGFEREMLINKPEKIIKFIFPNQNLTIKDFDSFESIRNIILRVMRIQHPSHYVKVFNLFWKEVSTENNEKSIP